MNIINSLIMFLFIGLQTVVNMSNNTYGVFEENISIPLYIKVISIPTLLSAFIINVIFSVLASKFLKKRLHNLLIICLCMNNSIVTFSMMTHIILITLKGMANNKSLCIMTGFFMSYSISTSYALVFLISLERYIAIKTFNFGITHTLERKKRFVLIGTHFFLLVVSVVVNMSLPTVSRIPACSPVLLYRNMYPVYMGVLWAPMTLLLLSVIVMYTGNCYALWKIFIRTKRRIHPLEDMLKRSPTKTNRVGRMTGFDTVFLDVTSNRLAEPGISNLFVEPGTSNRIVEPGTSNCLAEPGTSNCLAEPGTFNHYGETGSPNRFAEPVTFNCPAEPGISNLDAKPSTSNRHDEPSTSSRLAEPSTSSRHDEPGSSNRFAVPVTFNCPAEPGISNLDAKPSTSSRHDEPSTSSRLAEPSTSSRHDEPGSSNRFAEPVTFNCPAEPGISNLDAKPCISNRHDEPSTSSLLAEPGYSTRLAEYGTSNYLGAPGTYKFVDSENDKEVKMILEDIDTSPQHGLSSSDISLRIVTLSSQVTVQEKNSVQSTNNHNVIEEENQNDNQLNTQTETKPNQNKWEYRAFVTNLIVTGTTIFLSLPFVLGLWIDLVDTDLLSEANLTVLFIFNTINYFLDPLVYIYMVPEIRKQITRKVVRRNNRDNM